MKRFCLFAIILISTISCSYHKRYGLPFGDIKDITYHEVRRAFDNGLVFDKQGYQLEPVWKFHFVSDDSVQVYSPKKTTLLWLSFVLRSRPDIQHDRFVAGGA